MSIFGESLSEIHGQDCYYQQDIIKKLREENEILKDDMYRMKTILKLIPFENFIRGLNCTEDEKDKIIELFT